MRETLIFTLTLPPLMACRHDFFFGRFFQERLDAALAFVRHEAHQGQFVQRGTVFDAEGV